MRIKNSITRLMILLPVFILALAAPQFANASPQMGLNFKMWQTYNVPSLPINSDPYCVGIAETVNTDFHSEPICGISNMMTIEYTGFITPDIDVEYLYLNSDDGNQLFIDDVLISDAWYPSGSAGYSVPVNLKAGETHSIKINFFESGGGSWVRLNYYENGWVAVPSSWFTQDDITSTTTTIAPYLGTPNNLNITNTTDGVFLSWDEPTEGNISIGSYLVTFWDLNVLGGETTGGWGVWTPSINKSINLGYSIFTGNNPVTTGYGPVRFCVQASNWDGLSSNGLANSSCSYFDLDVQEPVTTTTQSPIPSTTLPYSPSNNGCGPYPAMSVTGTTGGTVWGSGPYTDDSAFGAAAVHAGLIDVGETAIIEPYAVDNYSSYSGTYMNGVHTNDWSSSWCGYQIKLLGQESPNTTVNVPTTTTSTTIEETVTSTTVLQDISTSTTIYEKEVIEIPETTTTEVEEFETSTSTSNPQNIEPTTSLPQYAPEIETPEVQEVIVPEDVQAEVDNTVNDIFDSSLTDKQIDNAVDEIIIEADKPEEFKAIVTSLLNQDLSDEQFSDVVDSVFAEPLSDEDFNSAVDVIFKDTSAMSEEQFDAAISAVFDEPLSIEQFSAALETVFDEPLSDEKFDSVINSVLDSPISDEQFKELVGVLESETITEEQVSSAVDSIIEKGVTTDQATELATSAKVLESITGEQASEIFDTVDIGAVTIEQAAEIVSAVQEAPKEVRESFETEINVFDGAIDTYVPLGSSISVGGRRVLIAIAAATAIVPVLPTGRKI